MANKYQREKDIIDRAIRETIMPGKEKADPDMVNALTDCLYCLYSIFYDEGEDMEVIDRMRRSMMLLWAIVRVKREKTDEPNSR